MVYGLVRHGFRSIDKLWFTDKFDTGSGFMDKLDTGSGLQTSNGLRASQTWVKVYRQAVVYGQV